MPRTRHRSTAAAEPVVTQEENDTDELTTHEARQDDDSPHQGLQFNEPLSWRPGRPIPVSDLLPRLQTLYAELCEIDQEQADRNSLTPKAQELAGTQLLAHKDRGVKAWALLCIVKMLYLLAPNAPYKAGQLKDIFTLFATQVIPAFADSTNPYSQQYIEIVTSFANDKSVLLLLDIPNSDALSVQIFQNAFDLMAGNGRDSTADRVPKNVEYQLTALLSEIVQEADSLTNEVVDVILAQFLRADTAITGGDSSSDITSPAYDMARAVCNSCTNNMTRHVSTYYSSVLLNVSDIAQNTKAKSRGKKRKHDEDDGDGQANDTMASAASTDDLQDAEKAHKLFRELWRSSPDVIPGVIAQVETELGVENVQLRVMAVQTIGDLISGIGATGLPSHNSLDPAAWPSQSVEPATESATQRQYSAPYSFSKVYPDCYQAFNVRHRDTSNAVRAAWVSSAGRIIATNAGGKGLDTDQEALLVQHIKTCCQDPDEKVRLATIEALSTLEWPALITILSKDGGLSTKGSLLDLLAARVRDPRATVRSAAMDFLARVWGVASGAMVQGDSAVHSVVGSIPTRILDAKYLNLPDVSYHIPLAIHDQLLPITFPPIKPSSNAESQSKPQSNSTLDPDSIRATRILTMVASLDTRSRAVFFGLQGQQNLKAKYLSSYLARCEAAANDKKDSEAKKELEKLIATMSKDLLDAETATTHFRQFAKQNDKRNHQLIHFCMAPDSDYRKVVKAMRELTKRVEAAQPPMASVMETLTPLLKSASLLIYNRSHVPTFMRFAKNDDRGLTSSDDSALGNAEEGSLVDAAHAILKNIAATSAEVFKIHAAELCRSLQQSQPTSSTPSDPSAVYTLKTCVGFAQKYPAGMPKDRAFYQAMSAYALYGSPPKTAKHAVSIILAAADRKEMLVNNILTACLKNFKYGGPHFLSHLAALAQLQLLANEQTSHEGDEITTIAVRKILQESRTTATEDDPQWSPLNDEDEDLTAKLLAIKILVNSLRGKDISDDSPDGIAALEQAAFPVYRLLNTLIAREGELLQSAETPRHHRAHLRLAAGVSLLKLCSIRTFNRFLSQVDFNRLTSLCQDPLPDVRGNFAKSLRKYLGRGKLPSRFLSLVFLYAFEPSKDIKQIMQTWIRARVAASVKEEEKVDTVLEAVFARFLSLLAHHPDFTTSVKDSQDAVHYIMFYLMNVATETNLPILYTIAQRLKTVQDGIDTNKNEDLYCLSDVAEATIRAYHEEKGWALQSITEKLKLPPGLFIPLDDEADAQELAEKRFLLGEMVDLIPDLVKATLKRSRKKAGSAVPKKAKDIKDEPNVKPQKHGTSNAAARKRASDSETPEPKSMKKARKSSDLDSFEGARRRSGRKGVAAKSYVEMDTDEDDAEASQWKNQDDNKENHEEIMSNTPATSETALDRAKDLRTTAQSSPLAKPAKGKPGAKTTAAVKKPNQRSGRSRTKKSDEFDISDDSS